jgi:hypothetical protein
MAHEHDPQALASRLHQRLERLEHRPRLVLVVAPQAGPFVERVRDDHVELVPPAVGAGLRDDVLPQCLHLAAQEDVEAGMVSDPEHPGLFHQRVRRLLRQQQHATSPGLATGEPSPAQHCGDEAKHERRLADFRPTRDQGHGPGRDVALPRPIRLRRCGRRNVPHRGERKPRNAFRHRRFLSGGTKIDPDQLRDPLSPPPSGQRCPCRPSARRDRLRLRHHVADQQHHGRGHDRRHLGRR